MEAKPEEFTIKGSVGSLKQFPAERNRITKKGWALFSVSRNLNPNAAKMICNEKNTKQDFEGLVLIFYSKKAPFAKEEKNKTHLRSLQNTKCFRSSRGLKKHIESRDRIVFTIMQKWFKLRPFLQVDNLNALNTREFCVHHYCQLKTSFWKWSESDLYHINLTSTREFWKSESIVFPTLKN